MDIVAQKQRPVSIQKEQSILSQKLVPMQLFGLALRTRQPTRTATEQRLVTLAITPTTPVTTTPRVPLIPFTKLPRRQKPYETFGFKVFVRGKGVKTKTGWKPGEFIPATKGVLGKKEAMAFGQQLVAGTAKRTFKLVPTIGKPAQIGKIPKFRPEMFYKKGRTYIEKTRFAIDQPGERKAITEKGISTLKGLRLTGFKPFRKKPKKTKKKKTRRR